MKMCRRDFMKAQAAAAAAAVAGIAIPGNAANLVTDAAKTKLKWSKAPCRFCGVGCGVMVATKGAHLCRRSRANISRASSSPGTCNGQAAGRGRCSLPWRRKTGPNPSSVRTD